MPLITCLGEALIDFLPIEEGGRTVGFRMHPGGSPLNVAVAVARLGLPAALAGKVSTDFFGRALRAYVASQGVDGRWLAVADAPSTLAFVATESGEPAFSFYGGETADSLLAGADLPPALFEETAIFHAGSISLLRGSTPATVLAACERLAGRALISIDPNIRPRLVENERAYRALLGRLFELADVVKLSAADLNWLDPGAPIERAAATVLARGPALVVVTRGGRGTFALRTCPDGPAALRSATFEVEVVDTVGAGDSFIAGLLSWLVLHGAASRGSLEGLTEEELRAGLRFAAAVAALNCTRAGADPPDRATVEAFRAGAGGGSGTPAAGTDGEGDGNDDH